ncbi:hypothetical protein BJV78DRAFT_1209733 [Lactifluus subvellereus]|nr:hypothetical protein BJV78DRAFT_1209733 [Lactifluus subvellereus]
MRVRGFHPFEPTEPTIPEEVLWQDWISSDGVFDSALGSFKRDRPRGNPNNNTSSQQQPQCEVSSGGRKLEPNANACQMEGTSWAGTAEENIQTYVSSIGVEESDPNIAHENRNIDS